VKGAQVQRPPAETQCIETLEKAERTEETAPSVSNNARCASKLEAQPNATSLNRAGSQTQSCTTTAAAAAAAQTARCSAHLNGCGGVGRPLVAMQAVPGTREQWRRSEMGDCWRETQLVCGTSTRTGTLADLGVMLRHVTKCDREESRKTETW
jgi:hypothetical protein